MLLKFKCTLILEFRKPGKTNRLTASKLWAISCWLLIVIMVSHLLVQLGSTSGCTTFLEGFLPDLTQKMFLISDMQDVPGLMRISFVYICKLNHRTCFSLHYITLGLYRVGHKKPSPYMSANYVFQE